MNSTPLHPAAKELGQWVLFVLGVVLLTLLFSFLGTIMVAVLAGMMMGVTRCWNWRALLVSAVFPAVILVLMELSKVELPLQQGIKVALLCCGVFYLSYLLTSVLIFFERKEEGAPAKPAARRTVPDRQGAAAQAEEARSASSSATVSEAVSPPPLKALQIEELQGKWWCETAAVDGQSQRRAIEIADAQVTLSVIDADGRVRVLARGDFRMDGSASGESPSDASPGSRPS